MPDDCEWNFGEAEVARLVLRDYQIKAKDAVAAGWATYSRQGLDMSTGTGKTSLLASMAEDEWRQNGGRTLVLENRDALVRQTAKRLADETGLECDIEMAGEQASPFAPIVCASVASIQRDARLTGFAPNHFTRAFVDECFPAGTLVDGHPIEFVAIGNHVASFNHATRLIEYRRVTHTFRSPSATLAKVVFRDGSELTCTPNHPVFAANRGCYVPAFQLTGDDVVCAIMEYVNPTQRSTASDVRRMQNSVPNLSPVPKLVHQSRPAGILRPGVQENSRLSGKFGKDGENESQICFSEDESEQPDGTAGIRGENENLTSCYGMEAPCADGQRDWADCISGAACLCSWMGYGDGCLHRQEKREWLSAGLQVGCWQRNASDWHRGGRHESRSPQSSGTRQEEGGSVDLVRVARVEVCESGGGAGFTEVCGDGFVYNLEVEGNNNYFADGILVHNCHHHGAASYLKVVNYFHYGAESLQEGWTAPPDGTYTPLAKVLGVSATWELSGSRNLGDFYQNIAYTYQLWEAIRDGWLVQPTAHLEPLAVDFKGLRATRTAHGSDYNPTQVGERMVPVIDALAKLIVRVASGRKTMAFMPSVKTAAMLAAAINAHGLRAVFVSGECLDRDSKTEDFVEHGPGIVLATSAMYCEGFDCPDVDCVFAGITKSVSYYRQKIGRATRPLKGIVNERMTAEERRAAIAASDKKDFLIIDPFFKCKDIDLCDVYFLYSEKPEVREKMKDAGSPSEEKAEKAERDFIKSLEKEARKHQRKATQVLNPLLWSVSLGDEKLATWAPSSPRDLRPVTPGQAELLRRHHVDLSKITCFGLAQRLIGTIMQRHQLGLAKVGQLNLLHQLCIPDHLVSTLTEKEASDLIDATLKQKRSSA